MHAESLDSLPSHGLLPARFLCPWNSPGRNTGVGCHALLQGIFQTPGSNPCLLHLLHWQEGSLLLVPPAAAAAAKSLQSSPTLCDTIDGSPPALLSLGFSRQEHWSGLPFWKPLIINHFLQNLTATLSHILRAFTREFATMATKIVY